MSYIQLQRVWRRPQSNVKDERLVCKTSITGDGTKEILRITLSSVGSESHGPAITALSFNQSVLIEQFSDHEMSAVADAIGLISNDNEHEVIICIERLTTDYVSPLADLLKRAGVSLDRESFATRGITHPSEWEG